MEKKEEILRVRNLDISFETTAGVVNAVRGVNLTVNRGETVAIVGESGSGKSVSAKAIMGILAKNGTIDRGQITFSYYRNPEERVTREILQMKKEEIRRHINGKRIAMVFQDPMTSLNPLMPVGKQIMEGMIWHYHTPKEEAYKKALELRIFSRVMQEINNLRQRLLRLILYTRSRIDCRKYGLDRIPKFRLDVLKRMLNVSFWTMIQNFFSLSTWFLFFLYVEHLGERSLAVTNIVRNVSGILFMVLMAFASTCGSLVSNLIGAGHSDCVAGTIRQHVRIAYVFVLPLALLFAVFPKLILGIYTDIPDLQDAAVHSLWVMCSTYLFLVPANVYFQAVSGTGNTRTAWGLEMATLVIYTAYITYIILILQLDVAICWTSEMVYSSFILIFCWLYIKRGNWQGRKI